MSLGKKSRTGIFIVDDHPIVYEGIEMLLKSENDLEVCGHAESANSAITAIGKTKPDLVIVDISLKGGVSGIDLIKAIRNRFPGMKMLVLSMYEESLYAERALRAGAMGYIKKEEMTNTVVNAIRTVLDGELYVNGKMAIDLIDKFIYDRLNRKGTSKETLSDREFEVLEFIAQGYKSHDIAKRLNISVRTIDSHKQRIRKKLNISSSIELMKFAIEFIEKP
jgi:DNA-binding NarL/FixJ family response regulator